MSDLEHMVRDRLHSLIGMSDKYVAQYFIGLAQKSSTVSQFVQKLKETDTVVVDQKMVAFAEEIWNRVCYFLIVVYNGVCKFTRCIYTCMKIISN